jgi:hypothetical protein
LAGGAIAGGSLDAAFNGAWQGGLTAGLFYGVGEFVPGAPGSLAKVAAHAAAGCASAVASSGSCGSGALAAGFAEFAGPRLPASDDRILETTKYAVLGGTAAVLGGGKFANGAVTGAFGYLFNDGLHEAGKAAEAARIAELEAGGRQVMRNFVVRTIVDGSIVESVVDYAVNVDGRLVFGEVKDGLHAKLSPGQKAVITASIANGEVAIANPEVARALGVEAKRSLAAQGVRLAVTLDATIGSRAAGQFVRALAPYVGKGLVGAATIFGSTAAMGAELLFHSSEAH